MTLKEYAEYLVNKNSGDTKLVKKVLSNSATLALNEGDIDSMYRDTEVLQYVEVMEENSGNASNN